MSLDRSLKSAGTLSQHRSVLTRAERISKMMSKKNFDPEKGNPLGLPKMVNKKPVIGKKKKVGPEKAEEGAAAAPATK